MTQSEDPTVYGRRLRVQLRKLREGRKLTQRGVAESLGWHQSKMMRIENGDVRVTLVDLRALLDIYDVHDKRRPEMERIAKVARQQPAADPALESVTVQFAEYLRFERSAKILRNFEPLLIPGLLQTEAYAKLTLEALSPASDLRDESDNRVGDRLRLRLARQEILDRSGPEAPEFFFVLDEAAARRMVGGPGVMREQLHHLAELNKRPNVTIQILEFSKGQHRGMAGSFVVLEFASLDDDDLLYVENFAGDLASKDDQELATVYKDAFQDMERAATKKDDLPSAVETLTADLDAQKSLI